MAGSGRLAAATAVGLALLCTGAVVRTAERWRSSARPAADDVARALRSVLPAHERERGTFSLVLLADPSCGACRRAVEDLEVEVRPEDLGVSVRVVIRGQPESRAAFHAMGHDVLPVYVLADERARPVALSRGWRPPGVVRAWLEGALAEALRGPQDRP